MIHGSWNWPFARKDMEVYGATGYAITVGPDKMRVRHEHDREEQTPTPPPLATNESNSLATWQRCCADRFTTKAI